MIILSLFDGISCGRVALDRADIKVDKYYSSEIDKYAIKISEANYPDIVRLGDVKNWKEWAIDWGSVDLLIGGSPCQGFSFAGKQLAFDDPRSALFFTFVDILNHIKSLNPNVKFLLENVRMAQEHEKIISYYLDVEPELINSALVSAQNRERLYWTNWHIEQPQDQFIFLKDIIEDDVVCGAMRGHYLVNGKRQDHKMLTAGLTSQQIELRDDGKTNTLTSVQKDNLVVKIANVNPSGRGMNGGVFSIDSPKAPTITTNKGEGVKIGIMQKARGFNKGGLFEDKSPALTSHSWQDNNHLVLAGMADIKGNQSIKRIYSIDGKAPTLTTMQGGHQEPKIQIDNVIDLDKYRKGKDKDGNIIFWRKLTPVECERLQTLPDGYTAHVSNSQRYKALGNGWTVDVIAHIFSTMNIEKKIQERLFA